MSCFTRNCKRSPDSLSISYRKVPPRPRGRERRCTFLGEMIAMSRINLGESYHDLGYICCKVSLCGECTTKVKSHIVITNCFIKHGGRRCCSLTQTVLQACSCGRCPLSPILPMMTPSTGLLLVVDVLPCRPTTARFLMMKCGSRMPLFAKF